MYVQKLTSYHGVNDALLVLDIVYGLVPQCML